jgi:S-adenosylmethionine:tRNA ribosyltransferase-isomerase
LLKSYSQAVDIPVVRTADFDFYLPEELIAQQPTSKRDESRLMVVKRNSGEIAHERFPDLLHHLHPGDVLVLNNSRVIPARLHATNQKTGGVFEILLLRESSPNDWWTLMRPAKRARLGTELSLLDARGQRSPISATVIGSNEEGHRRLRFEKHQPESRATKAFEIADALEELGEIPLPPYIKRDAHPRSKSDRLRYQTVYAREKGSVAAPTAGLHFTQELLAHISARGIEVCFVTLHVGLGTFAPVKTDEVEEHRIHFECFRVDETTARRINCAKQQQRRVIAVGTTSVRVLESLAARHGELVPAHAETNIFIYPPFEFRIVDALVTNFHLPRSTLLMLASAFAAPGQTTGREKILAAYAEAVKQRYRFFSYGDAMLIE